MIDVINKMLNKVFGNKSEKDMQALMPIVEEINKNFASYSGLSNDQLRAKTVDFQNRIFVHAFSQSDIQRQK